MPWTWRFAGLRFQTGVSAAGTNDEELPNPCRMSGMLRKRLLVTMIALM
jgi:hypothetical protein